MSLTIIYSIAFPCDLLSCRVHAWWNLTEHVLDKKGLLISCFTYLSLSSSLSLFLFLTLSSSLSLLFSLSLSPSLSLTHPNILLFIIEFLTNFHCEQFFCIVACFLIKTSVPLIHCYQVCKMTGAGGGGRVHVPSFPHFPLASH